MTECCAMCMHGDDTADGKIKCTIDGKKHEPNDGCGLFKYLLDD